MDIEYLREYLTIADELSLTTAAKVLNTTQSTLSKHVISLERDMGAELLRRTGRGIELTQAGTVLYRRARMIVDLYAGARDEIGKLAKKEPVRIGGMIQNGEVVSLLTSAWPLAMEQAGTSTPYTLSDVSPFMSSLRKNEVDLILCHEARELDGDAQLAKKSLLKSQFLLIVEDTHPLAGRTSVTVDDLKNVPLVQLLGEYATCGWQAIERACRTCGFEPVRHPMVSNGVFDCFTEPLNGAGLLLQRSLLPGGVMPRQELRCLPVTGENAHFNLCAYYRRADEARLCGLLAVFEAAAARVQAALDSSAQPMAMKPFQTRCRHLAEKAGLTETEYEAMVSYAKGRSFERIGIDLGLSRLMVGDLLASVYHKVGVREKQELLDAIEAMPTV